MTGWSIPGWAMIKAAYLRVYKRADGSEPQVGDSDPSYVLTEYGLISESQNDGFLITEWNDRASACPRLPRIRRVRSGAEHR